jgi:hypothetical protein
LRRSVCLAIVVVLLQSQARASSGSERRGVAPDRGLAASSADDGEDDGEDDDTTVGAEVDTVSRFIWRGMALSQGPVVQPSAWASLYNFNANLFTNVLLTDQTNNRLSTIVPSLSYTLEWKKLSVEPGFIFYDVLGDGPLHRTAEASVEGTLAFGAFHVLSNHYVDVATHAGAYYGTLGAELEPSFGKWTLGAKADVAWATADFNRAYFGASTAPLDLAEGTVSVRYELTKLAYAVVHGDGSTLLSSSLRATGVQATLAVVGATLGVEL